MINTARLRRLSRHDINEVGWFGAQKPLDAYVDRVAGWVIQVFDSTEGDEVKGTPWQGYRRVSVKHSTAKTPKQFESRKYSAEITWDDLQTIKEFLFPGRIALEIYPPNDDVVNVTDMRWLWVLPRGCTLPFNLAGGVMKSGELP